MELLGTTPSQDSSEVLLPTPSDDGQSAMEVIGKQSESDRLAGDADMRNGDNGYRDIPRTGIDFFEYRRALFLANQLPSEFPPYIPDTSLRIPTVLPEPLPPLTPTHEPTSAVGRLERLMSTTPRGEETDAAWKAGIENVFRQLNVGKKLAGGVRLGLVIKILRASWIQDGTWPKDPRTKRAFPAPPDSPRPLIINMPYPPRPCSPLDNHRQTLTRTNDEPATATGGPPSLLERIARLERRANRSDDESEEEGVSTPIFRE